VFALNIDASDGYARAMIAAASRSTST